MLLSHSSLSGDTVSGHPDKKAQIGNFPTRIVYHSGISEMLGINFYIKNEFEADVFGGGNKIRKLKYYLKYLDNEKITDVIADGDMQSNCCTTISQYCIPQRYNVHLVLSGKEGQTPEGNRLQMELSGANIYEIGEWDLETIRKKKEEIRHKCEMEGGKVALVDTGMTSHLTINGSIELGDEIYKQQAELDKNFKYIFSAAGTGGTHAGIEVFKQQNNLDEWNVVGVSIANQIDFFKTYHKAVCELFDNKISADKFNVLTNFIGKGYSAFEQSDIENILELRKKYGLILDSTYTYKCFKAIKELALQKAIPPQSNVLFIHTGGINQRFFPPYKHVK